MVNTRLSVAIHILSLIAANPRESSEMIAGSVNTNPVVIRRMISQAQKSRYSDVAAGSGRGKPEKRSRRYISA